MIRGKRSTGCLNEEERWRRRDGEFYEALKGKKTDYKMICGL